MFAGACLGARARSLSQAAALVRGAATAVGSSSSSSSKAVVRQRSVYQEQMTELRKGWGAEIKLKEQREEQRRAAEKQRLVLEKAIRLREKRKASLARQEQAKKKREEALGRYREKLARNHVVHAQRVAKQNESYKNLVSALEAESSTWITLENMDSKITEELFAAPATTGIVTRESRHWRHQVLTVQLKRLLSPEFVSESAASGSSLADRLQARGQAKSVKRLLLEEFLEPMIVSGKERANYQEILDKFSAEMEGHFVVDEELDTYLEYIMSKDTNFEDLDLEEGEDGGTSAASDDADETAAELARLRALQEEQEADVADSVIAADAPIDVDLADDAVAVSELDDGGVDKRKKSKSKLKPV